MRSFRIQIQYRHILLKEIINIIINGTRVSVLESFFYILMSYYKIQLTLTVSGQFESQSVRDWSQGIGNGKQYSTEGVHT